MNNAIITIKTNREVKAKAQETAREWGVSLSAVFNEFLRQFGNKRKTIDLNVKELEEYPNARTRRLLKKAEKDLKEGKASPVFNSAKEMIDWLHQQGV